MRDLWQSRANKIAVLQLTRKLKNKIILEAENLTQIVRKDNDNEVCDICIFFFSNKFFFLTLDKIDDLYFVYWNFCTNEMTSEVHEQSLKSFRLFNYLIKLNNLNINNLDYLI